MVLLIYYMLEDVDFLEYNIVGLFEKCILYYLKEKGKDYEKFIFFNV